MHVSIYINSVNKCQHIITLFTDTPGGALSTGGLVSCAITVHWLYELNRSSC